MSNLYLHGLDRYVRFADDFVALCCTRQEAEAVFAEIRAWVEQNGLRLHPDQTRLGNCRIKAEGFEFPGYRFEDGRR
ncbi:MAG: reverse transcriptase domain-containing protein [Gammaproteobacteria bacterium]